MGPILVRRFPNFSSLVGVSVRSGGPVICCLELFRSSWCRWNLLSKLPPWLLRRSLFLNRKLRYNCVPELTVRPPVNVHDKMFHSQILEYTGRYISWPTYCDVDRPATKRGWSIVPTHGLAFLHLLRYCSLKKRDWVQWTSRYWRWDSCSVETRIPPPDALEWRSNFQGQRDIHYLVPDYLSKEQCWQSQSFEHLKTNGRESKEKTYTEVEVKMFKTSIYLYLSIYLACYYFSNISPLLNFDLNTLHLPRF